jgi:sodium-dependent dicarboxylate transporter 2/3/5
MVPSRRAGWKREVAYPPAACQHGAMADFSAPAPPRAAVRPVALLLGPALFAAALLLLRGETPGVACVAGLTAWMACWWVTEALPVAATALLPLVVLPLAGVLNFPAVARDYGRDTIFLFLGGFLLALGLQKSGAHRRIALAIAGALGSRPDRLVLGFLLATAALSMWMSNTATTLLMLPIVLSVLQEAREQGAPEADVRRVGAPLLLATAYGATIGGLATPVGTPTNLVFRELYPQLCPDGAPVGFLQWMLLGVPIAAVYALVGWWLLVRVAFRLPRADLFAAAGGADAIARLRAGLGPVRRDERVAGALYAAAALLWITGKGLDFGAFALPGWQDWGPLAGRADDSVVAIGLALLLFALPSGDRRGEPLLAWTDTRDVPWGILLLFGGGFALGTGFEASGLSQRVAQAFHGLQGAPLPLVQLASCAAIVALSEFASNTATAQICLPILASAAASLQVDPRALLIPATFSASAAFMMPMGTPPNAIVFGCGYLTVRDMVRAGVWFNLLGLALVLGAWWLLAPLALG